MDAMENMLADFLSDEENQEFRFHSTMRSDANFNELHEEYTVDDGFHHSQFQDSTVSFSHPSIPGFFSDSALFTDVDWSFDGSQFDFSTPSWLKSNLKSAKEKTISALHIRNPELPNSCSVSLRSQEVEGLHIIGCERDINNKTLQSSGFEEHNDLNITSMCSGFQPNCFEKLDAEFLDVGCQTKATTLAENSAGTKCRNKDDLNPALVQGNEDALNSLQIAATFMTASSNNQIEPSSQSRYTNLESSFHRTDQTQGHYEQKSHTNVENFSSESPRFAPVLGISAAISVPNQAFKLEQSAVPSQPTQNICNAPPSGNQYTWEYGTVEDYGFVESYPNPTSSSSSPPQFFPSPILADMSLQDQLAQILSHVPIEPQKTKIDPKLQKKEKISQPTIRERVSDLFSSKFEDLQDRSFLGSRTASFHIKCQDFEDTPELCGQNCYLCRRDLSIKPEGSYMVTKSLPTVAVLPCSHAFHDFCLERITPQNQAHDPPCIPCAIGDI